MQRSQISLQCPCGATLLPAASSTEYDELFCAECGYRKTVFTQSLDRKLIQEGGAESAFQGRSGQRFSTLANLLRRWSARHRAGRQLFASPEPLRIIDFGCGQGFFLDALRAKGHVLAGIEISPVTAIAARNRGHQVATEIGHLPDQLFDLITSVHVLEHIPDPEAFLIQLRARLTTNGAFHVEVPNIKSLQANLFGKRWLHFEPGLHIHHFSASAFTHLLKAAGYSVTRVETRSLEHGLAGWVQSILNLAFPYNRLFRRVALNRGNRAALSCWPELALLPAVIPIALFGYFIESALGMGAVIRCEGRLAADSHEQDSQSRLGEQPPVGTKDR